MKMNEVVKQNLDRLVSIHHVKDNGDIVMSKSYFEFICEMIALDANLQGFKQAIDGRFWDEIISWS